MEFLIRRLKNTNWRLVAAALFAIGILHILATLAAPELTTSHAYDRMVADLPLNTMQILPPVAPDAQRVPFMSPDARYAVCPFDTQNGSVAISAILPGPGWVLALYSSDGDNFFASVAQPGRRTEVQLLLVPSEDRLSGLTTEQRAAALSGLGSTLEVAARSGVAVLRAPDQGQAYAARNLAELGRARCGFRKS